MSIAWGQGASIFQLLFMSWMLGSQLSIWTIFIFVPMAIAPVRAIFNVGAAFAPLASSGADLKFAKAVYLLINLAGVGFLAWKLRSMGLLPLTSADWVSLLPVRHATEWSSPAAPFSS
jgi:hypothetical protein